MSDCVYCHSPERKHGSGIDSHRFTPMEEQGTDDASNSERRRLADVIWEACDNGPNRRDSEIIASAVMARGWKHEHKWFWSGDPTAKGICLDCNELKDR